MLNETSVFDVVQHISSLKFTHDYYVTTFNPYEGPVKTFTDGVLVDKDGNKEFLWCLPNENFKLSLNCSDATKFSGKIRQVVDNAVIIIALSRFQIPLNKEAIDAAFVRRFTFCCLYVLYRYHKKDRFGRYSVSMTIDDFMEWCMESFIDRLDGGQVWKDAHKQSNVNIKATFKSSRRVTIGECSEQERRSRSSRSKFTEEEREYIRGLKQQGNSISEIIRIVEHEFGKKISRGWVSEL